MSNGTPFDKYFKGWKGEDPPYSRQHRDSFAVNEGLDELAHTATNCWCWNDRLPCGCWDTHLCQACDNRETIEARKLAARGKYKVSHKPRWGGMRSRWKRNEVDGSQTACSGEPHAWRDTFCWIPQAGYTHHRTKVAQPHFMQRERFMVCDTCGEAVKMRAGWSVRAKTRPMEPWETEEFEKVLAKQYGRNNYGTPKTYGEKEDGTPITRNEFKQAPRKRIVRKRVEEDT